ncbi:acyl-CoA dehydratase activase [Desulforhopalus sp. 52FAK]
MRYAGIDIGSRSIEVVVVDESGEVQDKLQADTGFDPMTEAKTMMQGLTYDHIMATGYGRNLFELSFDAPTVTEIKAHATGARRLFPNVHTILDIGGQDSKVIVLADNGRVKKFEMNDRCAAGTGKFLEIMAVSLGFDIGGFGGEALLAEKEISISSMCTVFAESEVTSLIAKGENRREIARGLHESVVRRAAGMVCRFSSESDGGLVFTGGVAKNSCIVSLLGKKLNRKIEVPDEPQFVGAFGAALIARENEAQA